MQAEALKDLVIQALEDMKAQNILTLDVRDKTQVTDFMVVATGTSTKHVQAVIEHLIECVKAQNVRAVGAEHGGKTDDWSLLDLNDVVCHVMTAQARAFYDLERLWMTPAKMPDSLSEPTLG